VADTARLSRPLAASEQVAHTMTRLDCFACHARDGVGGPLPSGRDAWFSVVGEADLGDEGRIPPHLDGAGAKLRETALNEILAKGAKARPYMATRMPVFGPASAALAPLLKQADRRPDAQSTPAHTVQDAKNGWKLVGREGVSCVSCHTFTTHGSLGIPALALDRMGARLEWDWLRRYLPDPAALRPGTRMPSFWPEGRAVNRAILDGDTDAQIRAVFAYLADGPKAEVPSGLIRGRKEIIVDQEPVIYRNFIEGAGPRAIGVGYPEHANLAYDAQSLRLALIWQGPFIDMARHSTDRGVGYEPPLGDHRVKLPDGPAFAVLRDPDAPWPAADKADGRFLGYRLDAARRPSFRVAVGGLEITETPLPRPGPVDMTLVRTFRAKAGTPGDGRLWLRVAKGAISRKADAHVVDGVLHIVARGPEGPRIVGDELRVPIDPGADTVVEMTW
jgi:cytochrome c553